MQAQSINELFWQGNAAQAAGDDAIAEAIFRHGLGRDPDNADAYSSLGKPLADQEQYEEAEAAYQEAFQLAPDMRQPNNLGQALWKQGRYAATEVVDRVPLEPFAHL
ncbi:MAG: tetratricopeptide repeat protein [Cyanobacteria bacterium P01_F01_bin.56]